MFKSYIKSYLHRPSYLVDMCLPAVSPHASQVGFLTFLQGFALVGMRATWDRPG